MSESTMREALKQVALVIARDVGHHGCAGRIHTVLDDPAFAQEPLLKEKDDRIAELTVRLEGKEHFHRAGHFCVACGIAEGEKADRLEEANKRAGEILVHAMLRFKRDAEQGLLAGSVNSAMGLLIAARLSSSALPWTGYEMEMTADGALKLADPEEMLKLHARVEQLVKDAPPAAKVERWKKLEDENTRLWGLVTAIVEAGCGEAGYAGFESATRRLVVREVMGTPTGCESWEMLQSLMRKAVAGSDNRSIRPPANGGES